MTSEYLNEIGISTDHEMQDPLFDQESIKFRLIGTLGRHLMFQSEAPDFCMVDFSYLNVIQYNDGFKLPTVPPVNLLFEWDVPLNNNHKRRLGPSS